jgi:hypothetical protein
LPAIPDEFDGSFSWLPPSAGGSILKLDGDGFSPLPALRRECEAIGLLLPDPFVRFVSERSIHERVSTCTGCYIELSPRVIDDPSGHRGRLIRFLNDSQGSMHWYLCLRPSGEHFVLASGEFYGAPCMNVGVPEEESPPGDPSQFLFCAPSVEGFIYRFWMENTIFDRVFRRLPLDPVQKAYVDAARISRVHV